MKEIKFRVIWKGQAFYWGFLDKNTFAGIPDISGLDIEAVKKLSCQYTGLEDKNGKDIYEGDIVLTDEGGWKAEVVFGEGMFYCRNKGFSSCCNWDKFEVIGNIYENSELLK